MKSRNEKLALPPSPPAAIGDEELGKVAGGDAPFPPGQHPGDMPPGQFPAWDEVKPGWHPGK